MIQPLQTIVIKGRERQNRGQLKNFYNLPENKQKKFSEIKKFLNNFFEKDIDVYVFGSFKRGYWDEFSDYDVIINEKINIENFDKLISEKLNFEINVFSCIEKNEIPIP